MIIIKKINNSKRSAVNRGKFKDPGAKLYDKILDSIYAKNGVIPSDAKELNDSIRKKDYMNGIELLREVYLVSNDGIKNSPYGRTPFSQSGCKYPHHIIKDDKLVISIPMLKHAYEYAWRHCELDKDSSMKRHLMRHLKELGLECQFHHGELYWNESTITDQSIMESNFNDIFVYIMENTGINLFDNNQIYTEASHGKLKYDFRMGYDYNTGHRIKVVYSLDNVNVTNIGYYYSDLSNEDPQDYLDYVKKNIRSKGNTDHQSKGQKVLVIEDLVTKNRLNEVKLLNPFCRWIDPRSISQKKENLVKAQKWVIDNPQNVIELKVGQIDNTPSFKSTFWAKDSTVDKIDDNTDLRWKKLAQSQYFKSGRGRKFDRIMASDFHIAGRNFGMDYPFIKNPSRRDALKELQFRKSILNDDIKIVEDVLDKKSYPKGYDENRTKQFLFALQRELDDVNSKEMEIRTTKSYDPKMMDSFRESSVNETNINAISKDVSIEDIFPYNEDFLGIYSDEDDILEGFIVDDDILEYLNEGWNEFLSEIDEDDYFSEGTIDLSKSKESFMKRWKYNSKNSTIKYEDREFKIDLDTDVESYKFKYKILGKESETSDEKSLCAAYQTSNGPVIVMNKSFWNYSADHQDAIILHEMGHIVCQMTPKPFPKSIKELIQRIKKAIQRLIARIRMRKYTKGVHDNGYKEIEADLWAAKRISPEIMKSLIRTGNTNELIRKKSEIIQELKRVNPKENFRKTYEKREDIKSKWTFDEYYERLMTYEANKMISEYIKDPNKNKDTSQRIAALSDEKLLNSKYFKTESVLNGDGTHLTSDIWKEIGDKTPQALYKWMYENIKYDKTINGWKLKSPEEVYKLKLGNCHDQSLFSSLQLHSLGYICGQLFFVECAMAMDNPDGNAHTLTWYRVDNPTSDDYKHSYYWFETAWENQLGIHGPFNDMESMKHRIIEVYNSDDDINSHNDKLDVLAMSDFTSHTIGMGYNKYIQSWKSGMKEVQRKNNLQESVSMDLEESVYKLLDEISSFVEDAETPSQENIATVEVNKVEDDFVPIFGIVKSYSHSNLRNDGTEKSAEELGSVKFDKIIHTLTRGDNYSHALVSFDISLKEMYSFEDAGFVVDNIMEKESWLSTKSLYICVMFVKKEERDNMKRYVETLKAHPEQTKYAMGNLIKAYIATPTKADKRFVCSSFTGYIMQCANPKNLHRDYSRLRPDDITILPRAFYVANVVDRNDFVKNFGEIKTRVQNIYNEYKDDIMDYNNHLPKIMLTDKMQKLKTIDKILDWIVDKLA